MGVTRFGRIYDARCLDSIRASDVALAALGDSVMGPMFVELTRTA